MKKLAKRGFTLVELMIVVAIIGVLAALAIFGVRKYLLNSKTAEARNAIGAINRAAVSAYEREKLDAQLLTPGGTSGTASHNLCGTSAQVPEDVPQGKKYQPQTATGSDYDSGNTQVGWKCLKYSMTEPTYFAYKYTSGSTYTISCGTPAASTGATANWWVAAAGDLDGDTTCSNFASAGMISNGQPVVGTQLFETNPEE